MDKCYHWIGYFDTGNSSERLYGNDYIGKILKHLNFWGVKVPATNFIDNRCGYSYLFVYCPYCGEKIDWKSLRKQLKEADDNENK